MDKEHLQYIQKNIDKIDSLEESKSISLINWFKLVISLLLGMLTVLITFNEHKSSDIFNHYLFSITLSLIGLSVILGTIFLLHQIDEFSQELKFHKKSLAERLRGNLDSILHSEIKRKPIFKVFKYIFYFSSLLSIISLIAYGVLMDK